MDESWSDLVKQLLWEMNPQDNWHGTPYTFNRFDDSKFLTGEGAAAHGPGHYSADDIKVGEGYRTPTKRLYNKSIRKFVDINPNEYANKLSGLKLKDYLVSFLDDFRDGIIPGDYVTRSTVEKNPLAMDIINNPENYDVRINKGNLYRVNVPNENFMWREGRWLPEQSEYIQNLWKNRNIDFSKYLRSGIDLEHDLEGIYSKKLDRIFKPMFKQMEYRNGLNDVTKRLFNRYMNELTLNEQMKFMERSGNKDKINEITKGIKGIRAKGMTDGPINVTFSSKDIKMANTPLQKVMNRIPTQTLGKMATKILQSPVVQVGGKILEGSAIPLTVLDMLKLQGMYPHSQQQYKQILKDMGIQYNNGQIQL